MGIFKKVEEQADEFDEPSVLDEEELCEDEFDAEEEEEETSGDFTVKGKSYVIHYTQKRIELYEQGHKPVMAAFVQNGGAFSIDELKWLLAYGLCLEGGTFVLPKRGAEMANGLINANGYLAVFEKVSDALQRDCGFFFKGATTADD